MLTRLECKILLKYYYGGMETRNSYNPKRKMRAADLTNGSELQSLAETISYGGNPVHKKNPGDFGLTPPMAPRPDKTLCDGIGVYSRTEAADLLKSGIRKGLISEQFRGGFPQNIWAVNKDGHPVEAQLDNESTGVVSRISS